MKFRRRNQPTRALRHRLLLFVLLPLLVLLGVSLGADYRIAYDPAQEAYDHALSDDVVELASRVHISPDRRLVLDLPEAAEDVLRNDSADREFLAVYGPDGRLISGDTALLPDAVAVDAQPRLSNSTIHGEKVRKASYRRSTDLGPVSVAVAETVKKRQRTASRIFAAMVLPNLLLVLATLVLVYFGVQRGLVPLNTLSQKISRRAPHDLSPLPQEDIPQEAEPLVRAMDGLITDLRAASMAQQAFLANAAHQLRTPLAGLQTQLELATSELPEQYRARMLSLQDAAQRLGHLTHQLLAMARSSPEANLVHEWQAMDLKCLLETEASSWYTTALGRQIDLGFEAESAPMEGSAWLVREMLGNLIDNALRYTPAGGQVTARTGLTAAGQPYLEVEDDGPGIPPEERKLIFERFYRPAGSPETGTGLGLAIVKEVADRHSASIELGPGTGGKGTLIRVVFLPAGEAPAV